MKKFFDALGEGLLFAGILLGVNSIVVFVVGLFSSFFLLRDFFLGFQSSIIMGEKPSFKELINSFTDGMISYATLGTFIAGILTLLAIFMILKSSHKNFIEEINLKPISLKTVPFIIILGVALSFITNSIISFILIDGDFLVDFYQSMISYQTKSIIAFLSVVIITPLVSEVVCRGLIQTKFQKGMPVVVAIILQAVVFGLTQGLSLSIIFTVLVGVVLGTLAYKHKSILSTLILHFSFTITNFLIAAFNLKFYGSTIIIIIVAAVIACVGCGWLLFSNKLNKSNEEIIDF